MPDACVGFVSKAAEHESRTAQKKPRPPEGGRGCGNPVN
jgi:hypothetical protein